MYSQLLHPCCIVMLAFSSLLHCFMLLSRRTLTHRTIGAAATAFVTTSTSSRTNTAIMASTNADKMQTYYQLVVNADGQTSMVTRKFTNVETKGYASTPQLVTNLDPNFATVTNVVFTQLQGDNPWHHCPTPQIVVCTNGGWWIETTDGTHTNLPVGSILFQDNTAAHPAAKKGTQLAQHYSASQGNAPCDQIIIQLALQNGGPMADSAHQNGPL